MCAGDRTNSMPCYLLHALLASFGGTGWTVVVPLLPCASQDQEAAWNTVLPTS